MHLLILQPFTVMPAMGLGGNKGPDPFPLAGMTLKGLLRLFSDRITAHLLLCLDLCLYLPSQL